MQFENRQAPEGINVSDEHPLKEFFQLSIGIILVVAVLALVLHLAVGYLVRFLPFEHEKNMVQHLEVLQVTPSKQQQRLQAVADDLVTFMDLPKGMQITVHYVDDPMVNAFATVGGHVFMFKGILEKLPSNEALAMVMAHEIAHIKHRHPIVALGKGLTLVAIGSVIVGASGSSAGQSIIGQSMNVGLLKFSRDQERQADDTAVATLYKRYGNVKGAEELFTLFADVQQGHMTPPAILSSHPDSEQRWIRIKENAQLNGWAINAETEPLVFIK